MRSRRGSASPCRPRSRWCSSRYGVEALGGALGSGWLHGLKVVAVAVVAQAVLSMMRSLAPDRERATLAVVAAVLVLAIPSAWGQIGAIVLGGCRRPRRCFAQAAPADHVAMPHPVSRPAGDGCAGSVLRAAGRAAAAGIAAVPSQGLRLFDAFYRAGSLVFGGGHVVLPLLQASVVPPGWVSNDAFLAGYGAAQAVPGPLFTFAAYLGAVMGPQPNGWLGGDSVPGRDLPAVVPARHRRAAVLGRSCADGRWAQAALRGVNAAVVGLLLAALYQSGLDRRASPSAADFALAIAAFLLLFMWQTPPWLVVVLSAVAGALISAF